MSKNTLSIHPRVRQLYKELIFAASTYGVHPLHVTRAKIKDAFRNSSQLEIDSAEWKRALAWGRYEVKNLQALHEVKTYRHMRRYDPLEESSFPTPFSAATKPSKADDLLSLRLISRTWRQFIEDPSVDDGNRIPLLWKSLPLQQEVHRVCFTPEKLPYSPLPPNLQLPTLNRMLIQQQQQQHQQQQQQGSSADSSMQRQIVHAVQDASQARYATFDAPPPIRGYPLAHILSRRGHAMLHKALTSGRLLWALAMCLGHGMLSMGHLCRHYAVNNRRALHTAAGAGQVEAVRLLLDHGADSNEPDLDGSTKPVEVAMRNRHPGCVDRLIAGLGSPHAAVLSNNKGKVRASLLSLGSRLAVYDALEQEVSLDFESATTNLFGVAAWLGFSDSLSEMCDFLDRKSECYRDQPAGGDLGNAAAERSRINNIANWHTKCESGPMMVLLGAPPLVLAVRRSTTEQHLEAFKVLAALPYVDLNGRTSRSWRTAAHEAVQNNVPRFIEALIEASISRRRRGLPQPAAPASVSARDDDDDDRATTTTSPRSPSVGPLLDDGGAKENVLSKFSRGAMDVDGITPLELGKNLKFGWVEELLA